jgi:hypothetical protein
MRLLFKVILMIAFARLSLRAAEAIPRDFEGWFMTTALSSFDEQRRYQFYMELQPRLGDNWHRMALMVVRPALVFNPNKNLGLYAGYAWVPKFYDQDYHSDYRDEQRLWQQLLYKHSGLGGAWHHRLRQEQRNISGTDGISNRTRYLVRGSYPLKQNIPIGLTGYSETFVNLNGVKGGPSGGFEQNRFFLGPSWERHNARYEVGYLGAYDRRFGDDDRWVNAIAMLAAFSF